MSNNSIEKNIFWLDDQLIEGMTRNYFYVMEHACEKKLISIKGSDTLE